jgi:GrpB-like predicted nucleotidyltransferase (UPF0157 family)
VKIRVLPYDHRWPELFEVEAGGLVRALGNVVVRLHHIGSTAIPSISAKPIIDILMELADLSALDRRTAEFEGLGYEAMGESGIPGRRYFRRNNASGVRTHQIHAFALGSPEVARHLAFRDYMIAHPDVARLYGDLKQRLAEQYADDTSAYMDGKDAFVKYHEARALEWRAQEWGVADSG